MSKRQLPTGTDWERVKREDATETSIDDPTEPYDSNETAVVSAYWQLSLVAVAGPHWLSSARP